MHVHILVLNGGAVLPSKSAAVAGKAPDHRARNVLLKKEKAGGRKKGQRDGGKFLSLCGKNDIA